MGFKFTLNFIILSLFTLLLLGQTSKLKWGKVNKNEINYKECSFERDANAVILADVGSITMNNTYINIFRHRRIKILSDKGLEHGNIEIPFYIREGLESISQVRAQTINIDDQGKIQKIKVENNKIFEVDLNEHWKAIRFTFPAIKSGSIIEYSYITNSKNFSFLDGWVFQDEIPTLSSQFSAEIPESLDYRILFEGRKIIAKYGHEEPVNKWELDNLPSLKDEPFVANYLDYAEKIRFQLAGYKKLNRAYGAGFEYVTIMTTWEKLAGEILSSANYVAYLSKRGWARDVLEEINIENEDLEGKIKKIYNYVARNYQWDGKNRIFPEKSFHEFIETKTGSNAAINLLLTLLFQSASLDANPVLVSTRQHGKVTKSYPFLSQFNYVIVNVNSGDKDQLMDGTDHHRPFNLINQTSLNGEGYLIDAKASRWIPIIPGESSQETTYVNARLDVDGNMEFDINMRFYGFHALNRRKQTDVDHFDNFIRDHLATDDVSLTSLEIENQENVYEPFDVKYTLNTSSSYLETNDILYFNPVLINNYEESPFKSTHRQFPVDYSYPFKEKYIILMKVPENFTLVEMPENKQVKLPGDLASFNYLGMFQKDTYRLSIDFEIKKARIDAQYYRALREFYDIIVAKINEPVVLRKTN